MVLVWIIDVGDRGCDSSFLQIFVPLNTARGYVPPQGSLRAKIKFKFVVFVVLVSIKRSSIENNKPIMSNKPPGLNGHSLITFDRSIYLFGGLSDQGYSNSLYEFDIGIPFAIMPRIHAIASSQWSLIPARGTPPAPRGWHTCTVIGKLMFVFGGCNGVAHNDLYTFDFGIFLTRSCSNSCSAAPVAAREDDGCCTCVS